MDIHVIASSSTGNCYRVTDGHTPLLLECGLPFKQIQQRLNFQTSELTGCLITHEHGDHSKAVKGMLKAGIDCYMSQGTSDVLGVNGHRVKIIEARNQFQLGTWTVLPFDVQHDAAEPLGFLLRSGWTNGEKLLYLTDTYYCKYKFRGLNYIMIEANHSYDILNANARSGSVPGEHRNRLIRSHMSLENVKEFLKANDLSRVHAIYLIHLSAGNSDADLFKREVQELTGKPVYVAGEKGE